MVFLTGLDFYEKNAISFLIFDDDFQKLQAHTAMFRMADTITEWRGFRGRSST